MLRNSVLNNGAHSGKGSVDKNITYVLLHIPGFGYFKTKVNDAL
jgi:hypothetical protein